MINRVLIRTKVVQLLYSFLLVEQRFSLESQPTPPTKEKRFAYALYMDTLALMIRVSRQVKKRGGAEPLCNRFILAVENDERMRSLLAKYRLHDYPYRSLVGPLCEEIQESDVYKNYCKVKADTAQADVKVWQEIFRRFIIDSPRLREVAAEQEGYSPRSFDRCAQMMEDTFTSFLSSHGNVPDALKSLRDSFDKARELYFRLLWLPVELTRLRDRQLDEARHKYLPTQEDLYPNLRFVENALAAKLEQDVEIRDYIESNKLSWLKEDPIFLNQLLKEVVASETYKEYMEFPVTDYKTDCAFWRRLMQDVILPSETFLEQLETQSIFWNDDLDIMSAFVLKTMKRIEDDPEANPAVMPMYKDDEDASFGAELFRYTVSNKERYLSLVHSHLNVHTWDADRLAFMDVVILLTAVAEILNFPKIPLHVTVNEYIEIAKAYSTPKSGQFVHGILGAVIADLQEKGELAKRN